MKTIINDATKSSDYKCNILIDSISDYYLKKIKEAKYSSPTFKNFFLFITDIPPIKIDSNNSINAFARYQEFNSARKFAVFMKHNDIDLLKTNCAHEIAHLVNLKHTFADKENTTMIISNKETTNNIMDYSAIRNSFYFYQWKQLNPESFTKPKKQKK
jgi:hypothetical protein